MALDIYSVYAQLAAIEQMPREHTLLWDLFVNEEANVEEDKAFYDYKKGIVQMAPIVHENTGGVLMRRGGYETNMIDFCNIAPERLIQASDIKVRFFGEKVFGGMSPEQREKKMLAQDQVEMRKAIQNRREWMVRQIILTGKLEIFKYTNEGRDKEATMQADFGFTQFYIPETKWNQPGAKIEYDMKRINDLVVNEGLGWVDIILMAPDVAEAMYANSDYLNQHNILRLDTGTLESTYKGPGLRFLGRNADGIDMYSFSGKFLDDDNTMKDHVPSGHLIAGKRGMIKCAHGPVLQVESTDANAKHKAYVKREVPLRHASIDGNSIKNRITSRPAMMPYNVDGWCVAKVL